MSQLTFIESVSPLDYDNVLTPARLALIDSQIRPPKAGETYFADSTISTTKSRKEFIVGAGPDVASFVDFTQSPQWLTIHYLITRKDQRGRGHMRRLLDELLARHGDESKFISFGKVFSTSAEKYIAKLERTEKYAGRVQYHVR